MLECDEMMSDFMEVIYNWNKKCDKEREDIYSLDMSDPINKNRILNQGVKDTLAMEMNLFSDIE